MFEIGELFDLAIRLENNGEKYYRHFAQIIADPEIKRILSWLADQEIQHAHVFARLKQMNVGRPSQHHESPDGLELQSYIGDRALSLDDLDLSSLTDRQRVLQVALEFENDTILFFDMLSAFVSEEPAMVQLQAIISEERRHIEVLQTLIIQEHSAQNR